MFHVRPHGKRRLGGDTLGRLISPEPPTPARPHVKKSCPVHAVAACLQPLPIAVADALAKHRLAQSAVPHAAPLVPNPIVLERLLLLEQPLE